jgi:6-phosphofructokinase 1
MKTLRPAQLGPAMYDSQLPSFVGDEPRVPSDTLWPAGHPPHDLCLLEKAGPRRKLFFDPAAARAAIVTCGGLCPGLNNVIRSVTRELRGSYGVGTVLGIRGGYRGLDPSRGRPPIELTDEVVADIHRDGGTLLGTSRGPVDLDAAVDFLMAQRVNLLFTVGGDGTQRGGLALFERARARGFPLAVVGVPKTIDNDVRLVTRTFGHGTAVSEAVRVIQSAHTEARCVEHGVALVKLMGRHAGFIAAGATVASQDVNFCLVPEQPFALDGEHGLLAALERRLARKPHAVIVVAEGAGQDLLPARTDRDASGNLKLADIGLHLRERIVAHFASRGVEIAMRYFDPSYQIRGCPADAEDALLCDGLARHAVHAGMAGKTGLVVSYLNGQYAHVPISEIARGSKRLDLEGELWRAVLSTTGQAARLG